MERVQKLGLKTYYILTKTRDTLIQERLNFSLYAPRLTPIPCLDCDNHAVCHSSWKSGWWNAVGQNYLLCSPHPPPLKGALNFIKSLTAADFPGIHHICFTEAMKDLMAADRFAEAEDGVVEDAVVVVQAFNETQTLYYRVNA
ncbi:hypothetical protein QCA50_018043 [Cerrena zonata]|uniref:Uncharacterized protein n=1 Tax=Cerrena zonata TaxID=2478898 RepID=A0AAW0FN01_9APHY